MAASFVMLLCLCAAFYKLFELCFFKDQPLTSIPPHLMPGFDWPHAHIHGYPPASTYIGGVTFGERSISPLSQVHIHKDPYCAFLK